MAVKIKSTKGIDENGIKVLVYGKGGIGKTTLMGTAPSPIVLSCEGGLLSLKDQDIPYIEIETVEDIYEAYEFLRGREGRKYKTICLDSISEIAEVVLADWKKKTKDARQAYGEMAEEMAKLVKKFRDLKRRNVVFSAKRMSKEDADTGLTQYVPMMPGKNMVNFLPYQFDEVFYMTFHETDEGKKQRVIITETSFEHDAKDRSGALNNMERPNLTRIFKKISGSTQTKPRRKKRDK